MKKILSSPYSFIVAGVLFVCCSYWIYKNVKLEDLVGVGNNSKVSETAVIIKQFSLS